MADSETTFVPKKIEKTKEQIEKEKADDNNDEKKQAEVEVDFDLAMDLLQAAKE